ncbi:nuclear pore complex Nup98-Nup96 isoform X2 [Brachionus plicatilis]|uniref:Nuclear pore complex protein Nup98-Nup96 n=1 Tax=Brachionus plicatilis TaxID=10195 RepID=A0A3M7RE48_BRAPC|nr:nuclear pore complex Nup98-Nup96 isoform X2 [Brachionus plicatilis]
MNSGFSSDSSSPDPNSTCTKSTNLWTLAGINPVQPLFASFENQTGSIFDTSTTTTQIGTGKVKFFPLSGHDSVTNCGVQSSIQTNHQCITAMKEYEGKSLEELRFGDYQANCKFQNSSNFGTSIGLFGSSTQSTSSGYDSSRLFSPSSTVGNLFSTSTTSPNTSSSSLTKPSFDFFGTKQTNTTSSLNTATTTGFGQTIQPFSVLFGTSTAHRTGTSPIVSANPSFSTTGGLFGSSTQHNHQQNPLFGGFSFSTTDKSSSNFPCKINTNHSPPKANISFFDLMKTQFWSNENLNIDEKLSEINVKIILPCGFAAKYDKKIFKKTNFECPVCKDHSISSQDCLNMTRNKLVLVDKLFELKKKIFEEMIKKIEVYKNDTNQYIQNSYDKSRNDIEIQQIDKYCDDLLEKVEFEKDTKESQVNEKIKYLDLTKKAIDSMKIDKSLDVYSRINILKNNNISIDNGIDLVSKFEDYLTESKFKLTDGSKDIDLANLFGELYSREKTSNIFDIDEICEKNRTEATVQLVINDISKFENSKNLNFYSKRCRVGIFEWSIYIKFICTDNREKKLGFYLQCNSIEGLSKFPVDVHAQFTLVDRIDPNNNLTESKNYTFTYQTTQGFDCFIKFYKFSDLINSYYNNKEDSMTFKAYIISKTLNEYGFKGGFVGELSGGFSTQGNQTTSLFETIPASLFGAQTAKTEEGDEEAGNHNSEA